MELRYVRKGECVRCGWCCRADGCEHLKIENGMATCMIYADRFKRCRLWPEMPPILYEGCGYWFVDTWEDNRRLDVGRV